MKLVKHAKERSGAPAPVSRGWPPLPSLRRLQEDIDRLFEEPFGWLMPPRGLYEGWGPPVDLYEDKDKVVVKIELPGMKKEELEVNLSEGMLNISGERKQETEHKGAGTYQGERYFGRFHRSIALPTLMEPGKAEAHYKDGVLTVICPKAEEAKRKEIEIKVE